MTRIALSSGWFSMAFLLAVSARFRLVGIVDVAVKTVLNEVFDICLNVVFNARHTNTTRFQMKDDAALIEQLGGPTKVSDMLGFSKQGGPQRVQNWIYRGIPAQVKVDHPSIFMRDIATRGSSEQEKAA